MSDGESKYKKDLQDKIKGVNLDMIDKFKQLELEITQGIIFKFKKTIKKYKKFNKLNKKLQKYIDKYDKIKKEFDSSDVAGVKNKLQKKMDSIDKKIKDKTLDISNFYYQSLYKLIVDSLTPKDRSIWLDKSGLVDRDGQYVYKHTISSWHGFGDDRKLLYKYPDDIRGRQFTTSEEFSKNMKNNAIFPGVLAGSSFALGLLTTINPYLAAASTGTIVGVNSYLDKKKSKEGKKKLKKNDDDGDSKEEASGDDGSPSGDDESPPDDIDPDIIEAEQKKREAIKRSVDDVVDKFKEWLRKKDDLTFDQAIVIYEEDPSSGRNYESYLDEESKTQIPTLEEWIAQSGTKTRDIAGYRNRHSSMWKKAREDLNLPFDRSVDYSQAIDPYATQEASALPSVQVGEKLEPDAEELEEIASSKRDHENNIVEKMKKMLNIKDDLTFEQAIILADADEDTYSDFWENRVIIGILPTLKKYAEDKGREVRGYKSQYARMFNKARKDLGIIIPIGDDAFASELLSPDYITPGRSQSDAASAMRMMNMVDIENLDEDLEPMVERTDEGSSKAEGPSKAEIEELERMMAITGEGPSKADEEEGEFSSDVERAIGEIEDELGIEGSGASVLSDEEERQIAELERLVDADESSAEKKTSGRQEIRMRQLLRKQNKYAKTLKELKKNWQHSKKRIRNDGSPSQSYAILYKTNRVLNNFLGLQDIPSKDELDEYDMLITTAESYNRIAKRLVRQKKKTGDAAARRRQETAKELNTQLKILKVRSEHLSLKIQRRERSPGGSSKTDIQPEVDEWETLEAVPEIQKLEREWDKMVKNSGFNNALRRWNKTFFVGQNVIVTIQPENQKVAAKIAEKQWNAGRTYLVYKVKLNNGVTRNGLSPAMIQRKNKKRFNIPNINKSKFEDFVNKRFPGNPVEIYTFMIEELKFYPAEQAAEKSTKVAQPVGGRKKPKKTRRIKKSKLKKTLKK